MNFGSNPARFQGIAAVTFDGDGTLWDFEQAMRTALERSAAFLNEAGLHYEDGPLKASWLADVRDEVAEESRFKGASMEAIRLAAFEEAVRRCDPDQINLAHTVYSQYMADRFSQLSPYAEVIGTLTHLQRDFQLALVTNGNTHPSRVGLERWFVQVVIAFECGIQKPNPDIYALTADRLGIEVDACLHVGDDPYEDVDSARRAGMRAVWVNREKMSWPMSLTPSDAEIRNLAELVELLGGEEQR